MVFSSFGTFIVRVTKFVVLYERVCIQKMALEIYFDFKQRFLGEDECMLISL